jgi:hypothetical protein
LRGLCPLLILAIPLFLAGAAFAQDPMNQLKEETLSYFKPLKGRILSVEGKTATSDLGEKSGVRKGMRLAVFREGTPFLHPVTKEPMGKVEALVGMVEVKEVTVSGSTMEVKKGEIKEGDIARVSEMKVRVLFFQEKKVDWNIAEAYYQLLKGSDRFEILDTPLDSADDGQIIAEAKRLGAAAAIVLTSEESEKEVVLRQRILWAEDGVQLAEVKGKVDEALVKELKTARNMAAPLVTGEDVLLFFDLPFSPSLLASGDLNGDGNQELIFGSGRELFMYTLGASLQSANEFKVSGPDEFIWIDTMDINGDGKDEIIVTAMRGREVDVTSSSNVGPIVKDEGRIVSYIYSLKGTEFSLLWKGNVFLRALPKLGLVAQKYSGGEGFDGPVFRISYDAGKFTPGDAIKLPMGVNIYDFQFVDGPDKKKYLLAYDDAGFLNVYTEEGLRVWQSREPYPGVRAAFKRSAPTVMVSRGEWSVKDRVSMRNNEFLVVKRIPLTSMVRGLGFNSSQIKTLWWTGLSMEENTLIDSISGSVIDYALLPDRLVVLSRPLFGLKPKNILKGESPVGSMLYVYSLKGR